MSTPQNRHMAASLADDFRTALTLQVPATSEGRLTDSGSDMGESSMSSRGGSDRGGCLPKISIMKLGDEA